MISFAKLFGISVSFTVILFALSYVYYETSFDKCVPGHELVYRCLMQGQFNGNKADFAVTSSMMAEAVLKEVPEVVEAVRITSRGKATIQVRDESIDIGTLFYADPDIFDFFGLQIYKSTEDIFVSETSIAIAESVAVSYFNSVEEALNQVVRLHGEDVVITGVFEDLPPNFHLKTQVFQSIKAVHPEGDGWGSQNYYTYIKTNAPVEDLQELNFKLTKTVYTHFDESLDGANAKSWEDLKNSENTYIL